MPPCNVPTTPRRKPPWWPEIILSVLVLWIMFGNPSFLVIIAFFALAIVISALG